MNGENAKRLPPLSSRPKVRVSLREHPSLLELRNTFSKELGVSRVTAEVLVHRQVESLEAAKLFLSPTLRDGLPDPRTAKNLSEAATLILQSTAAGEKITVYSDFDVDGVTAGSQFYLFMKALGADVHHFAPNRFTEGYGVIKTAVERLCQDGTKLLVTVDCGISNAAEIQLAKSYGVKTVVIDHHQVQSLPPADVVVDPEQEGCGFQPHKLCAAGLVWILLIELRRLAPEVLGADWKHTALDPKDFLDLAAMGTICDMVPLRGLNRIIAYRGVEAMRNTKRIGLRALKDIVGISNTARFGASHISFQLGPRINAAGRLADAREAFELLTTEDSRRAGHIADRINRLNAERQALEEILKEQCLEKISLIGPPETQAAFAVFGDEFHVGVIGIVAQRLVEMFHRPAAVMAPGEMATKRGAIPIVKGSVRSVSGFHVAEALQALSEHLVGHGGHKEAGGFSVTHEKRERFEREFVALADRMIPESQRFRTVLGDVEVQFDEIDFDLVSELSRLAPFGMGNPSPLLVSRNVRIDSVLPMSNNHVRIRFNDGKYSMNAVGWRLLGHELLRKDNVVSIAHSPEINTYQGVSSVQLTLKEIWKD